MNRRQRNQNRYNADLLAHNAKERHNMNHICENCGERGGHWVAQPWSVEQILKGIPQPGYYTCKTLHL